jgi:predicted transcriptional regulator
MTTTIAKTSTTDMEVTSIRLERELKERLKGLAGDQGYQALVREVLWNYVYRHSDDFQPQLSRQDIRASIEAIARREEHCALTGQLIRPEEKMYLGLTADGDLVPLSQESW